MNANRTKIRLLTAIAVLMIILGPLAGPGLADDGIATLRQTSKAFSEVAKKVTPAVVSVRVKTIVETGSHRRGSSPFENEFFEHFFGPGFRRQRPRKEERQGLGSGFIISSDGYIMTNNHVVEAADEIEVTLKDGRKYDAEVIGTDPDSDVAVIKIDGKDLPVVELGDSDALEVGEWVIAVGNPFGLLETVTVGVVSAKGRSGLGMTDYEDFIQTDAAINLGNSGGPLLNLDGEAIGINTFIIGQTGIGFAIPINMAKAVKEQLIETGNVTRGYVGIEMNREGVTPELAESFGFDKNTGVLIAKVQEDTPAQKAGLKPGDIIIEMDGKEVKDNSSFRNAVSLMAPGTKIRLTIFRDGREKKVTVEIGSLPDSVLGSKVSEIGKKLGLNVQEITKDIAKEFGIKAGEGVIVTDVARGSPAYEKGIEPGWVILSVNEQYVSSVLEFNAALEETSEIKRALLLIRNNRGIGWVVLYLEQ